MPSPVSMLRNDLAWYSLSLSEWKIAGLPCPSRKSGWWISPSKSTGEKPRWSGPFATIETACLAIGRRLATEIADRHTRSIERHQLTPDDALYGLKPTTRLDAP